MSNVTIECRDLKKSYGKAENRVAALKSINLSIHKGELTLLVGPSGSGKTTLVSIITTILTADEGELIVMGQDVGKMSENQKALFRRVSLGIVFQSLFMIPTLSVLENVTLPLIVAGETQQAASEKALFFLEKVHLANRSGISPFYLSKGQQQRVAIARAMVNNAQIIVCDEPTSALDHVVDFEIMDFLHDLAVKESKTVLVVSHDHRIFPYADRIIEMSDGQIISEQKSKGHKHE